MTGRSQLDGNSEDSILDKKSKCKGPEADMSLACLENRKKTWEAAPL